MANKVKQRGQWSVQARTRAAWNRASLGATSIRKKKRKPKTAREGTDYNAAHPNPNYNMFLYLGGPQLIDENGIWYRFPKEDDTFATRWLATETLGTNELLLWAARPIRLGKLGVQPPDPHRLAGHIKFYKAERNRRKTDTVIFTAQLRISMFDYRHASGYVVLTNVDMKEQL